jgi:hypothetical protein
MKAEINGFTIHAACPCNDFGDCCGGHGMGPHPIDRKDSTHLQSFKIIEYAGRQNDGLKQIQTQ